MVWNRVPEEAGRGLMLWCDKEFLDVKVRSAVFTAEARGGRLWGVAECQVVGQLSPEELGDFLDFANAAGSTCATKTGAIPALPTTEEIEACRKSVPLLHV